MPSWAPGRPWTPDSLSRPPLIFFSPPVSCLLPAAASPVPSESRPAPSAILFAPSSSLPVPAVELRRAGREQLAGAGSRAGRARSSLARETVGELARTVAKLDQAGEQVAGAVAELEQVGVDLGRNRRRVPRRCRSRPGRSRRRS